MLHTSHSDHTRYLHSRHSPSLLPCVCRLIRSRKDARGSPGLPILPHCSSPHAAQLSSPEPRPEESSLCLTPRRRTLQQQAAISAKHESMRQTLESLDTLWCAGQGAMTPRRAAAAASALQQQGQACFAFDVAAAMGQPDNSPTLVRPVDAAADSATPARTGRRSPGTEKLLSRARGASARKPKTQEAA